MLDGTPQNTPQPIEGINQLSRLLRGSLRMEEIEELVALLADSE